jgi:hypothetical protein
LTDVLGRRLQLNGLYDDMQKKILERIPEMPGIIYFPQFP